MIHPVVVNGYPYLWDDVSRTLHLPDQSSQVDTSHITKDELRQISDCLKWDNKKASVKDVFSRCHPEIDLTTLNR